MDIFGFIVKAIIVSVLSCGLLIDSAHSISTSEMRTHLISVNYNPYGYAANEDAKSPDDAFGQESIKIENRQLYDTVKHASGYDPDANANTSRTDDANDKQNASSPKIFVAPRKSAVIQAIPRKVRGPGSSSSSTTTSSPYTRHPSLHAAAKDYGTGEPTTTIVYATSIPTTSSRAYVNIRPVPLLPTQKYRSTLSEDKQEKPETTDSPKPVLEKFFDEEKDHQQQEQQKSQLNVVLEKPTFKGDSSSEQATTTPGTYDAAPYHIEQRKRNLYKSIPYARIRTNEDIEKMPTYNRNSFVNPYPNHKWSNEDFIPRMSHHQPHPLPPASPPASQFVYDNGPDVQQSYYQASPNQHDYSPRYPAADEYHDEMYRNMMHSKPIYGHQQPPPIAGILSQQQDQQRQAYQPLTVRDFELLLQLLVLRERRLSGSQDPYSPSNVYPGAGSDGNFYGPPIPSGGHLRNREGGLARPGGQQSSVRLLPPNVREELLFRMLLLALHMQPLTKPTPVARNHPLLQPQYTYLNPPAGASPPPYLGYRQHIGGGISKNPIRSVQVLGEID